MGKKIYILMFFLVCGISDLVSSKALAECDNAFNSPSNSLAQEVREIALKTFTQEDLARCDQSDLNSRKKKRAAGIKSPLSKTQEKLLGYIANQQYSSEEEVDTQIREISPYLTISFVDRYVGGFPTSFHLPGGSKVIRFPEANPFIPLQVADSLKNVFQYRQLPQSDPEVLNRLNSGVDKLLDRYIKDQKTDPTAGPCGTIAYWPKVKDVSVFDNLVGLVSPVDSSKKDDQIGDDVRTFFPQLGLADIPNDFDDSASAVIYCIKKGSCPEGHLDCFGQATKNPRFLDIDNKAQYPWKKQWSEKNSGGVLTWLEQRKDKKKSRIPNGDPNEVDCVVNMNVLYALKLIKERQAATSSDQAFEKLRNSICKMVNKVIEDDNTKNCSLYYNSVGNFFFSFSRLLQFDGTSCFTKSIPKANATLYKRASQILSSQDKLDYHEAAEILIALKRLNPVESRGKYTCSIISLLEEYLKQGITTSADGKTAHYEGTYALFYGLKKSFGNYLKFEWSSPSMTNAYALEALTLY